MAVARVFVFVITAALWGGLAKAQPSAAPAAPNAAAPNAGARPSQAAAPASHPTPDDICRALEQDAAENELPVEFFARVIWQESRFNARAVSHKGAQGIAQFMPATADYRGLVDPFDPIEALKNSAPLSAVPKGAFGKSGARPRGLKGRPGGGELGADHPRAATGRAPRLCRHHHRLDCGRMGLSQPAENIRDDDPARRAVH